MNLDKIRYIWSFSSQSPFFPLIVAWSCNMSCSKLTHSLSGGGRGMKGYAALECTLISLGYAGKHLGPQRAQFFY
jgi:hypothetical protein